MDINTVNPPVTDNYPSRGSVELPSNGAGSMPNAASKAETVKEQSQPQEKDKEKLDREDINQLTEQLNKFMKTINADLHFELHEETKRMMVQFVDQKDKRVIKEFPPHELLDTLAAIRDYVGVLLDKRA